MKDIIGNRQISKVFSATFLLGLTEGRNINYFEELANNSNLFNIDKQQDLTIKEMLDKYYLQLLQYYKNEYVYKNLLIKDIKPQEINKQFSLISEMDIGNRSRVDLALFSDTNIAYEIKTDLDTFSRLNNQLEDYTKGFEQVWVITSESKVEKLSKKIDNKFGIKYLDEKNNIFIFQDAKSNIDNITHAGLFTILRKKEFIELLKRQYGHVAHDRTQSSHNKLVDMFTAIDIKTAHQYTVDIVKYRTRQTKLLNILNKLPSSLMPIGLNTAIQKEDKKFFNLLNLNINQLRNHMSMMEHGKLF